MENNRFIHLFSNISIVKGFQNAIILDPSRECYYSFPNGIAEIFHDIDGKKFQSNQLILNGIDSDLLKKIIDFGIENELLFFSDLDKTFFPKIKNEFDHYLPITNIIWDIPSTLSILDFSESISDNIDELLGHIEIRSFNQSINLNELEILVKLFSKGDLVMGVMLTFPYNKSLDYELLTQLFNIYPKLWSIQLHSGVETKFYSVSNDSTRGVFITEEKLGGEMNCGCVHTSLFSNNYEHIRESKIFNSCLTVKYL